MFLLYNYSFLFILSNSAKIFYKNLGKNFVEKSEINLVKQACKELNITQKELAEMIGVSESTIKRSNRHIETTLKLLLENYQLKSRINNFQNSFTSILQPI